MTYSRSVARMCFGENVGGCAPVSIGDNCFIGMNATLLMGTTIGNNCIIGAFLLRLKVENSSQIREDFLNWTPLFDCFEDFLAYACKELGIYRDDAKT